MEITQMFKKFIAFFKKHLVIFIIIAFVISLIPIFLISRYDRPAGDDYSYSTIVHQSMVKSGFSLANVINASLAQVKASYISWQGTYAAVFLMTLQPGVFSDNAYALVPYIMLGILIFGTVFLLQTILKKWLHIETKFTIIISALILFLQIQFVPSKSESFFWYNGSVYYTFFYALMLIYLGMLIRFILADGRAEKLGIFLGSILLAFIIGGGNYVTALLTLLIGFSFIIVNIYKKSKKSKYLIIQESVLFLSFLISVLAPGNLIRQNFYIKSEFFHAIFYSINQSLLDIKAWNSPYIMLTCILLLPVFYAISGKVKLSFKYPAFVMVFSILVFASQYAPSFYTMTSTGPLRLQNIIFFSYIWLIFINLFYLTGWFRYRFARLNAINPNFNEYQVLLKSLWIGIAALLFLACMNTHDVRRMTSVFAYQDLWSGTAQRYAREMDAIIALCKNEDESNIIVAPITAKPISIMINDLSGDDSSWINSAIAIYFNKESLTLSK